MTPDVNVLVAASRKDHPHHVAASTWLYEALEDEKLVLLPMVATSFIRIVTSPRIFPAPTPVHLALKFVNTILDATDTRLLPLSPEWARFGEQVERLELTGNLVTDAWIAAAVEEHGEHLVTFDKDFRKLLTRTRVTVLTI